MMMSIDGRQNAGRWTPPAAGINAAQLRGLYDITAARFDADASAADTGIIVDRRFPPGRCLMPAFKTNARPSSPH
jgi:hypothetical protein